MKLTNEANCYTCKKSSEVVILGGWMARPLLYSPDGNQFFELVRTGLGGSSDDFKVSYDDPHHNDKGEMKCQGDTLTWGKKVFEKTTCPPEVSVTPIPTVRVVMHIYRTGEGEFICISRDQYKYQHDTVRFFIGTPMNMKALGIKNIEARRDGGTMFITTEDDRVLYIPTPIKKSLVPTWDDNKIVQLDETQYNFQESGDEAKITNNLV